MRTAKDNFWLDTPYEAGPALAGDHETDVAIIGGGFTGVASAYFMKKRFPEKRIIVLAQLRPSLTEFGGRRENFSMVSRVGRGFTLNSD